MSMSACVIFTWLHLSLTSRQPAVIYHTTGLCVWPWIQLLCVISGGNMASLDAVWLFLVLKQPLPATCFLPSLPPYRSASGIGYDSKNYLTWQEIQLAIYSIVGEQIDYKQLSNCGRCHASICFPSLVVILEIIKLVFLNIHNFAWKVVFSYPLTCNSYYIKFPS